MNCLCEPYHFCGTELSPSIQTVKSSLLMEDKSASGKLDWMVPADVSIKLLFNIGEHVDKGLLCSRSSVAIKVIFITVLLQCLLFRII